MNRVQVDAGENLLCPRQVPSNDVDELVSQIYKTRECTSRWRPCPLYYLYHGRPAQVSQLQHLSFARVVTEAKNILDDLHRVQVAQI